MKENFKEIIKKGKWLSNTLLTILLMAIIVAIVIALNIFLDKTNISDIDLTKEKLYSLSEESKEKIKNITKETKITLYGMNDYPDVLNYAQLYNKENALVTYEELTDPTARPDLQQTYGLGTVVTGGVIIIEADGRNKVISASDLYTYDYTTYEEYNVTEQLITNAILDVNLEKHPQIYFVTNHAQNAGFHEVAKEVLRNEANDVADLDLLVEAKIPEDCNVLVLTTLSEDFSEYERDIILGYINNGGNMMILADPNTTNISLPNFQAILDLYGASISSGILYEQNTSRMANGYTNIIIPDVNKTSEITKHISSDGKIAVLNSGLINFKTYDELKTLGITREDLIISTDTSFQRTDFTIESATINEADQETSGEPIASLITKKISDENSSKIVLCANSLFVSDIIVSLNNSSSSSNSSSEKLGINFYNNRDFLINSISNLTNRNDNITLRKDTGVATYIATAKEDTVIRTIIIAIPILIILTGIMVWQIRRRKK